MTLRVYTVLDATLPAPIALDRQTRLWIVAERRSAAVRMLTECGVTWREETFAGPVKAGPFLNSMRQRGLLEQEAVLAYPMPWRALTPVRRVDSPRSAQRVAVMGDVLGGVGAER